MTNIIKIRLLGEGLLVKVGIMNPHTSQYVTCKVLGYTQYGKDYILILRPSKEWPYGQDRIYRGINECI